MLRYRYSIGQSEPFHFSIPGTEVLDAFASFGQPKVGVDYQEPRICFNLQECMPLTLSVPIVTADVFKIVGKWSF